MMNVLAGIAPVAGVLRLAGGLFKAATAPGPKGASFAEVQQRVLESQGTSAPTAPRAAGASEQALRAHAERLMRRLDGDGNGTLSAAELGIAVDEFGQLDVNADGALDLAELMKGMQSPALRLWEVQ